MMIGSAVAAVGEEEFYGGLLSGGMGAFLAAALSLSGIDVCMYFSRRDVWRGLNDTIDT